MKLFQAFCLALTLLLVSCKDENMADAKIFERKEEGSNQLIIKYQYEVNGTQYTDSATIENIILEGDIIQVKYEPSNPQRSVPLIKK